MVGISSGGAAYHAFPEGSGRREALGLVSETGQRRFACRLVVTVCFLETGDAIQNAYRVGAPMEYGCDSIAVGGTGKAGVA
jgi:hypothetical protein